MTNIDLLGYVAAIFTTVSFMPQAVRVIKTRDTRSLSLAMYSILTIGVALWLVYGLLKQDGAMIVANTITFFLSLLILSIKAYNVVTRKDSGSLADKVKY